MQFFPFSFLGLPVTGGASYSGIDFAPSMPQSDFDGIGLKHLLATFLEVQESLIYNVFLNNTRKSFMILLGSCGFEGGNVFFCIH